MEHVAFLRSIGVGQRGQPRAVDLIEAFESAGSGAARSFQSAGTVLFDARDSAAAQAIGDRVQELLWERLSVDTVVFTRSLGFVEQIVDGQADAADLARRELTVFDPAVPWDDPATWESQAAKRQCAAADRGPGWAVVANDVDRQSNGTPTVEAALHTPASSRSIGTLLRLMNRFGR